MTTLWWLTVLALAIAFAALAGYWFRAELELGRRATRGEMMDFTRKRVGL